MQRVDSGGQLPDGSLGCGTNRSMSIAAGPTLACRNTILTMFPPCALRRNAYQRTGDSGTREKPFGAAAIRPDM